MKIKKRFLHLIKRRVMNANTDHRFYGIKEGDIIFVEKAGGVESSGWGE
jgi:predicted RNase H-like nuclease (RuvC/YqgF family)